MELLQVKLEQTDLPPYQLSQGEDKFSPGQTVSLYWSDQAIYCELEDGQYVVSKVTLTPDKTYHDQHYFQTPEQAIAHIKNLF